MAISNRELLQRVNQWTEHNSRTHPHSEPARVPTMKELRAKVDSIGKPKRRTLVHRMKISDDGSVTSEQYEVSDDEE